MEAEQSKRSLLKTLTWRITASLDTFVIAWIITGIGEWVDLLQEQRLSQKYFFIIFTKEYGIKLIGEKRNGGGYLSLFAM